MPEQNTREYYSRRAAQATEMAVASGEPMIAAIHREMAQNYEKLAANTNDRPKLRMVSSG